MQKKVKKVLNKIIDNMAKTPAEIVFNPGVDFTRNRKLGFKPTLDIII